MDKNPETAVTRENVLDILTIITEKLTIILQNNTDLSEKTKSYENALSEFSDPLNIPFNPNQESFSLDEFKNTIIVTLNDLLNENTDYKNALTDIGSSIKLNFNDTQESFSLDEFKNTIINFLNDLLTENTDFKKLLSKVITQQNRVSGRTPLPNVTNIEQLNKTITSRTDKVLNIIEENKISKLTAMNILKNLGFNPDLFTDNSLDFILKIIETETLNIRDKLKCGEDKNLSSIDTEIMNLCVDKHSSSDNGSNEGINAASGSVIAVASIIASLAVVGLYHHIKSTRVIKRAEAIFLRTAFEASPQHPTVSETQVELSCPEEGRAQSEGTPQQTSSRRVTFSDSARDAEAVHSSVVSGIQNSNPENADAGREGYATQSANSSNVPIINTDENLFTVIAGAGAGIENEVSLQ